MGGAAAAPERADSGASVNHIHETEESQTKKRHDRVGIPATCYRTENAQIPKSAGESAGKSTGKKRTAGGTAGSSAVSLHFQRNRLPSTAPSSPPPPAVPFFPALSLALLGIWAFSVL